MVSEEDKRRMRRLGEDLEEFELHEPIEGEALRNVIRWANEMRAKAAIPPLETHDADDIPEQGFFERAKALGMVKPRGEDPRRHN